MKYHPLIYIETTSAKTFLSQFFLSLKRTSLYLDKKQPFRYPALKPVDEIYHGFFEKLSPKFQDENSAVILVSSRSLNSRMPPRSWHVKEKNIKCINVRASLMIYPMKGMPRFAGYGSPLPPDTLGYNIERNPWGEWGGLDESGPSVI